MTVPLPLRPGPAQPRFLATVGLVVLMPMLALALLGLWFLDADKLARAQAQRQQQQQRAEAAAAQSRQHLHAEVGRLSDAALTRYRAGGAEALRRFYLGDPRLALVVLTGADGAMTFPEPQEMPLYAEQQFLRQARLRLAEARAAAGPSGEAWSGSLAEPSAPAVVCRGMNGPSLCLLIRPEALPGLAGQPRLLDLAAPDPLPADQARVLVPLPAPFSGHAVAIDDRPDQPRGWLALALLLAPTVLGTGIAAALLVAAERAQRRNARQRIDMLAEISHELRTPLANLRLYSSMLAGEARDPARVARHARIIEDEAARLAAIVENALAVTLRGAPPGRPRSEASPDALVQALLERFVPSFADGPLLHLDLKAPARLRLDRQVFEQVLLNLLDNARKHASGARVTVSTRISGDQLLLDVRDDGAQAAAPRDGIQGFGLGLRACASMAEQAGGRFEARIAPGGSRFTLSLPCEPATPTAAAPETGASPCAS